jgi:hypothetical protein
MHEVSNMDRLKCCNIPKLNSYDDCLKCIGRIHSITVSDFDRCRSLTIGLIIISYMEMLDIE